MKHKSDGRSPADAKMKSSEKSSVNYSFYIIFGLVTFFIWCDLSFFGELSQSAAFMKNTTLSSNMKKTIKLRMQDHFGHYIYLPFTQWLERTFSISKIPGVTPNLITGIHFLCAIISGKLFASMIVFIRQCGVLLYEFRSMLDILDGVVYRAQAHSSEFVSGWGTYGYLIDGLADTIGGLFLMAGTIYRFNKSPPFKNPDRYFKLKTKHDLESQEKLFSGEDSCNEELEESYGLKRYSRKAVNIIILLFTIHVILRSAMWDHFLHAYHDLLERPRTDVSPVICYSIY